MITNPKALAEPEADGRKKLGDNMGDKLATVKLAAVQAASIHLDRDASVEKACQLIREAGSAGANLIGFPEGFIPAHPSWYTVFPATGMRGMALARTLFQNAVVIPSDATDRLSRACRDARISAVIGICEKRAETTGTMFNTQLFIGEDGTILGKHRKIMPTVGERLVHTGGGADTLTAYQTPIGKVSAMICTENANPLAVATILDQYPVVHVAAWPAFVSPALELSEIVSAVSRGLAYSMGCYVINACGVLDDATIEAYQASEDERSFLERCKGKGCASIVGPNGQIITKPLDGGEGIVYAEVDLNSTLVPKLVHDFAGHYTRPDLFSLYVNRSSPTSVIIPDTGVRVRDAKERVGIENPETPESS